MMYKPKINIMLTSIAILFLVTIIMWSCSNQDQNVVSSVEIHSATTHSQDTGGIARSHPSAAAPDLTVDAEALSKSCYTQTRIFSTTNCGVIEGCVQPGRRKLLRFAVVIPNLGTADWVLGNPADRPDLFEYSPCHGHYHYKNFAEYYLKSGDNIVVTGRKQSFCLRDDKQYVAGSPSGGYHCEYQGLSAGWGDVYGNRLDCQWLDITGLPKGDYILGVKLDIADLDQGPNIYPDVVEVPIRIRFSSNSSGSRSVVGTE